jgi:uncharacterized protein
MIAPFEMNDTLLLGSALLFGVLFGVFLERGGLGVPHKLIGVFYLRDFTAPKVMLSAIIVASIGLYFLADVHLLDLTRVWIIPTFFWPQVVGGMLFGSGFLLCGYCPGTSIVGFASGRLDALIAMIGIVVGSLLFAIVYPHLEGFYFSSEMGGITIQKYLATSHWVVISALVVVGVTIFAIMDQMTRSLKSNGQE